MGELVRGRWIKCLLPLCPVWNLRARFGTLFAVDGISMVVMLVRVLYFLGD